MFSFFKKKAKTEEVKKVREFDPKRDWAKVPGGMERIEVPGGWIYMDYIRGHSVALCFVPFPKDDSSKS